MKRFSLYIIVAFAAFFALPAVAQQQDQPKAQEKKPVRVITEDDISSTPTTATKTTDAADAEDKDKKPEADAEEDDDRSDVDKAKEDVKKWSQAEESLKSKLATLQEKEANEPSEFRKQMYRDAYNNQQTTLGEFAEKKAKAEKELAEAQAKENEEGPKPKKEKKAGTADQSKQEEPPQ